MALASPQPTVFTDAVDVRARNVTVAEPLLKRPFDIVLATTMLVASALVWAAIALAIKLEDGGPVFYRQERWGRDQTRFRVLKFRSMVASSDRDFGVRQARANTTTASRGSAAFCAPRAWTSYPSSSTSWSGDMSFVGPRALSTDERNQDGVPIRYEGTPGFATRLLVRPGLTGLATIYLPKDASSRLKFRTDLLYVRRLSFWLDVRLVALSFWISFRGKWETRSHKV